MSKLRVKRGDTIELDLVVKLAGVPQDITGATLTFTAKARLDDADDAAVIRSLPAHVTIPDQTVTANRGKAKIAIPGSFTSGFTTDRTLYWDVQIVSGTVTKTLDDGLLYVQRDVTRT